jgi:tetratricopeptide (TPR) repeat protein
MNEFLDLYKKIKQTPFYVNAYGSEFINKGMYIYNNTNEIDTKTEILNKLIEIYPNEPAFYYYMGYSLKDINPSKALPFYEKSYQINPDNVENLIDYCNILYEFGHSNKVIEMDKKHPFGYNLKDIRFLNVVINCKYKQYFFKDILNQLLYVIKSKSKTPAITNKDQEWKFSNYLNTGHIYSFLGDHDKSIQYNEKAVEIAEKFNLDINLRFNGLNNLMALEDYKYHNLELHYKKTLKINDLYPNQNLYNCRGHKTQF